MKTISAAAALFWMMLTPCASTSAQEEKAETVAAEAASSEDAAAAKNIGKEGETEQGQDSFSSPKTDDEKEAAESSEENVSGNASNSQFWQYVPFNPLSGKTFYKESLMFKKGGVSVLLSVLPINGNSSEQDAASEIAKRIDCQTDQASSLHLYPAREADLSKRIAASGTVLPQGSFYKISCAVKSNDAQNVLADANVQEAKNTDAASSEEISVERASQNAGTADGLHDETLSQPEKKSIPAWDTEILPADIYIKRGSREFFSIAVKDGDLADVAELMAQQQKDAIVYQKTYDTIVEARNAAADKAIEESKTQILGDDDEEIPNTRDSAYDEILGTIKDGAAESASMAIENELQDVPSQDARKSEISDDKNNSESALDGKVPEKKNTEE